MYDTDLTPEPAPGGEPDAVEMAGALAREQLAVLRRMVEAGVNVMATVERRAMAEAETGGDGGGAPPGRDPVIAYARITRSMRLTQALQSRIVRDLAALEKDEAGRKKVEKAEAEAAVAQVWQDAVNDRKVRIYREVESVALEALSEHDDDEDGGFEWAIHDYQKQTGLLLDAADHEDLLEAPLGALVERICRKLKLEPDWAAMAREPWAITEAQTGDPRSPFVTRPRDADEPDEDSAEPLEPQSASP